MSLVQARGLTKHYGDVAALDGFDLTIEPGRIVGLIGPNGSGKTTALKSILGLALCTFLGAAGLSSCGSNDSASGSAALRFTAIPA